MKARNRILGAQGEQAAADYLQAQGYVILARNVHTRAGELDIVAQKRQLLAFIEVKTRTTGTFGPAAAAVDKTKQRHICAASALYLQQNALTGAEVRYDVITVDAADGMRVHHIENAFGYQAIDW